MNKLIDISKLSKILKLIDPKTKKPSNHVLRYWYVCATSSYTCLSLLREIQKRNFLISLETISKIPLFENLPVGAIGKINSKLHALLVPPHKTIISNGENSDAMYIIEFGAVEVELEKPVILSTGDYFGERGLL